MICLVKIVRYNLHDLREKYGWAANNPLAHSHIGNDVIGQVYVICAMRRSPRKEGNPASFAGKTDQFFVVSVGTAQTQKVMG